VAEPRHALARRHVCVIDLDVIDPARLPLELAVSAITLAESDRPAAPRRRLAGDPEAWIPWNYRESVKHRFFQCTNRSG
jgi:hypothetical protein